MAQTSTSVQCPFRNTHHRQHAEEKPGARARAGVPGAERGRRPPAAHGGVAHPHPAGAGVGDLGSPPKLLQDGHRRRRSRHVCCQCAACAPRGARGAAPRAGAPPACVQGGWHVPRARLGALRCCTGCPPGGGGGLASAAGADWVQAGGVAAAPPNACIGSVARGPSTSSACVSRGVRAPPRCGVL